MTKLSPTNQLALDMVKTYFASRNAGAFVAPTQKEIREVTEALFRSDLSAFKFAAPRDVETVIRHYEADIGFAMDLADHF